MKDDDSDALAPILANKLYDSPSVFTAPNLLREARRQKSIPRGPIPEICVLDPDGDLWRGLQQRGARGNPHWACYHTEMFDLNLSGTTVGVLGCAVGAPFAVLVAEEMFASGCKLLLSVTSAGQIMPAREPPYFVLIDRALRDEGTSYHYLAPARYSTISATMLELGQKVVAQFPEVVTGGTWTTDAPFRETEEAIGFARAEKLLAVEMEAAALYALAEAMGLPIVCVAHVTNQMGTVQNDFEKGQQSGNASLIQLIAAFSRAWEARDR
jgi:uridine phosphorylase